MSSSALPTTTNANPPPKKPDPREVCCAFAGAPNAITSTAIVANCVVAPSHFFHTVFLRSTFYSHLSAPLQKLPSALTEGIDKKIRAHQPKLLRPSKLCRIASCFAAQSTRTYIGRSLLRALSTLLQSRSALRLNFIETAATLAYALSSTAPQNF